MSKRKSLNDVLSNDRAVSRMAQGKPYSVTKSLFGDDEVANGNYSYGGKKDYGGYGSCYVSHPPLKLTIEGQEYEIRGGNCGSPIGEYDVLIGFAGPRPPKRFYPWLGKTVVDFPIQDMGVPTHQVDMDNLIKWTVNQLKKGRKVYCGCIGGHGRTGLFLSALVKETMGVEDAITHVRTNYCHKAVESTKQIDWLHEHYGITKVKGSKSSSGTAKKGSKGGTSAQNEFRPMGKRDSIWGA